MPKYESGKIETKWQKKWSETGLYKTDLSNVKHKYYNLTMFPYPSGDKLHMGHWYNYAPHDSWGRYMRMKGYNVFEPMGFDAFGLPAENYAVKTGVHPTVSIKENVETMIKQLARIGTMYDWEKMVNTSTPEYYKWTQWVFLQMYKNGLAYKKKAAVNWCPSCNTVLANEQVKEGHCDRCDSLVTHRDLEQWFWKLSSFAQRLLDDMKYLDWPEKTLTMQRNWIGRSEGIDISYDIEGLKDKITVFTTRPDTNFGATFIVVAPEAEFVRKNVANFKHKKEVAKYIEEAKYKSDIDRIAEGRKKTGVFTGLYAINQLTDKKMPIYVSDFVLAHVGTGCVVGVPGHDIRDFEFAQEKGLEIIRVVVASDGDTSPITKIEQVQEHEGTMINSDFLNGLDIHAATVKIMDYLEKKGWGKRVINYKLRDWLISRQRYWGSPIPIVYCPKCGEVPVPEKELPVLLPPLVDFKPTGKAPLATSESFVNTKCPKCGGKAQREVDTMDTFVCSSFYQMRYLDNKNKQELASKKVLKDWYPVDMYIGGSEHACMHLIYARFIYKALQDFGAIPKECGPEPYKRLVHQGIITKDGAKMSKSKGNTVSPDEFVEKYGSDVFRMYLMFMGPFTDGGDWSDAGISGIVRFVERIWRLLEAKKDAKNSKEVQVKLQQTIKKVTADIEKFHFNTAISALMELLNVLERQESSVETKKIFVLLLAPLAPHLAEELNEKLGGKYSIFDQTWPTYDEKLTISDTVIYAVQVNGKLRGTFAGAKVLKKDEALKLAREVSNVKAHLDGKEVVKEIFVAGKLVGFVV